jgi:hypothetical protein
MNMSDDEMREEDVELGEQVETRTRSGAAVVAVRVSRDLLARINGYGRQRGITVSEVLREGAERLLDGAADSGHYVSGASVQGPSVIPGSPSSGGRSRTLERDEVGVG